MNNISLPSNKPKTVATDPKTVPSGIGSSTFLVPAIPESVLSSVPLLHEISIEDVACIMNLIMDNVLLYDNTDGQLRNSFTNNIIRPENLKHMSENNFTILHSALYCVVKTAIGSKVQAKTISEDFILK